MFIIFTELNLSEEQLYWENDYFSVLNNYCRKVETIHHRYNIFPPTSITIKENQYPKRFHCNFKNFTCFHCKCFVSLNHQDHCVEKNYEQDANAKNSWLCQLINKHPKLSSVFQSLWHMLVMLSLRHNEMTPFTLTASRETQSLLTRRPFWKTTCEGNGGKN